MVDLGTIAEGSAALKAGFDMLRSALGLMKDSADVLPEGEKKDAVNAALLKAEDAAKIAEAQIAQALGYELCRCQFPPVIMLKVGHAMNGAPVYECRACKQNTAAPYRFSRRVPE